METVANNFLPLDSESFMQGLAFAMACFIIGAIIDLVYAHVRALEHRRAEMRCRIRYDGASTAPCHMSSCPAKYICYYYAKPRHFGRMVERIRHWIDTKFSGKT